MLYTASYSIPKSGAIQFKRKSSLLIPIKCVIMFVLSYRYLATGGGVWMEFVISFFVSVMAGVACHLICKWLDRNDLGNE